MIVLRDKNNNSLWSKMINFLKGKKGETKAGQVKPATKQQPDNIKLDDITFKEGYDADYWPALVCIGIAPDPKNPVQDWVKMGKWVQESGLINNGYIVAAHRLSDNIKGDKGSTVTVIEFSKGTTINSAQRLKYTEIFKWPEDFFNSYNSYQTWYKSGKLVS